MSSEKLHSSQERSDVSGLTKVKSLRSALHVDCNNRKKNSAPHLCRDEAIYKNILFENNLLDKKFSSENSRPTEAIIRLDPLVLNIPNKHKFENFLSKKNEKLLLTRNPSDLPDPSCKKSETVHFLFSLKKFWRFLSNNWSTIMRLFQIFWFIVVGTTAPLRWNFSFFKMMPNWITLTLEILQMSMSMPSWLYYGLYWLLSIAAFLIIFLKSLPMMFVLNYFGSKTAKISKELFFALNTAFLYPIIQFLSALVTFCISKNIKNHMIFFKYESVECEKDFAIITYAFGLTTVALLIVGNLLNIWRRHSKIERSKQPDNSIVSERSIFSHQFMFIVTVFFTILNNAHELFSPLVCSCVGVSMCSLVVFVTFYYEPYEDERILAILCGGATVMVYTNCLGLYSTFLPYNTNIPLWFFAIPIAFLIGFFGLRLKNAVALKLIMSRHEAFDMSDCSWQGLYYKSSYFSRLSINDQDEETYYFNLERIFRGAPRKFSKTFCGLLVNNHAIGELDLKGNKLNSRQFFQLLKALSSCKGLKGLNVSENNIHFEKGISSHDYEIMVSFFHQSSVTYLNFNINPIDDGDFGHIMRALLQSENSKLQRLSFRYCSLTYRCSQALNDLLGVTLSSKLCTLDIGCNQIRSEGARYISQALAHNKSLVCLNLERNEIGPSGLESLLRMLKTNQTLCKLFIGSNKAPKCYEAAIKSLTCRNANKKLAYVVIYAEQVITELGGIQGIREISDFFYALILSDRHLRGRFLRLKIERMRFLMGEFLIACFCSSVNIYKGRTMAESHSSLNINHDEYDQVVSLFVQALQRTRKKISEESVILITAIIENLRDDIVTNNNKHLLLNVDAATSTTLRSLENEKPRICYGKNLIGRQENSGTSKVLFLAEEINLSVHSNGNLKFESSCNLSTFYPFFGRQLRSPLETSPSVQSREVQENETVSMKINEVFKIYQKNSMRTFFIVKSFA